MESSVCILLSTKKPIKESFHLGISVQSISPENTIRMARTERAKWRDRYLASRLPSMLVSG
jgi:hypothetical protein